MGTCATCGGKTGLMSSECATCSESRKRAERAATLEREAQARVQAEEARKAAIAARQRRLDEWVARRMAVIEKTTSEGRAAFLYREIYMPMDSMLTGLKLDLAAAFNIEALVPLGYQGWTVVGFAPRTFGALTTNQSWGSTHGESWGAGTGGNVVGVHVVLALEIPPASFEASRPTLEKYLGEDAEKVVQ